MDWTLIDGFTVLLYFVLLFSVCLWVAKKPERTGDDYFLASRSIQWWAVAASLFASNIGVDHIVSLTGEAAIRGIAVAWYEWGAILCLIALGRFFLPIYFNSRVSTMPEWVEKRYSGQCRTILVVLSLFLYVFVKLSASLYAGQVILQEAFGLSKTVATVLLVLGTAAYTVSGGLSAVIYTEVLQTVILIGGGLVLMVATLVKVGGLASLQSKISEPYFFHIIRPATDSTFPWPGLFIGFYVVAMWYWNADQIIVQRALAAKDIHNGNGGCIAAGFLKILPGFLFIIPGMAARALMFESGDVNANSSVARYDIAYPWLLMNVMPKNLRGLVIAALLSALMSSLASTFNSSATIFSLNVYQVLYPNSSNAKIVWVGRVSVAVMAFLSLLWLPVIPLLGSQLFLYMQKPYFIVAPPVMAIFLWGMLFPSLNATGALCTLLFGVMLGSIKFGLELLNSTLPHPIPFLSLIGYVSFLYFAILSFSLCTAVLFAVSYFAPADDRKPSANFKNLLWRPNLYEEVAKAGHQQYDIPSSVVPLPREKSAGGPGSKNGWEVLPTIVEHKMEGENKLGVVLDPEGGLVLRRWSLLGIKLNRSTGLTAATGILLALWLAIIVAYR